MNSTPSKFPTAPAPASRPAAAGQSSRVRAPRTRSALRAARARAAFVVGMGLMAGSSPLARAELVAPATLRVPPPAYLSEGGSITGTVETFDVDDSGANRRPALPEEIAGV